MGASRNEPIFNPDWGGRPPHFVGRQEELRVLLNAVQRGRAPLIVGRRGVGKTCLIRKAEERLTDDGWVVQPRPWAVHRSLSIGAAEAAGVLIRAAQTYAFKTSEEVPTPKQIGFVGPGSPDDTEPENDNEDRELPAFAAMAPAELRESLAAMGTDELASEVSVFLEQTVGAGGHGGKKGLVVILDEFQMFAGSEQTSPIDLLVGVITRCKEMGVACRFILAGMPIAKSFITSALGGAVSQVSMIEIGHLSREEAVDAIQTPLSAAGISFEPELIDRIIDDTAAHPKLVQFFSQGVLDLCPESESYSAGHYEVIAPRIEELFWEESYPDIDSLPTQKAEVLWAMARAVEWKAAKEKISPELAVVRPKEIRQFLDIDRGNLRYYLTELMAPGAEYVYKARRGDYGLLKPLMWKLLLQMRVDVAAGLAFEGQRNLEIPADSLDNETKATIALKNYIVQATKNSQQVWIVDEYWKASCVSDYLHLVDSRADIYLLTRFERQRPDGRKTFDELRKLRAARAGGISIANLEGPSSAFPVKGRYIIIGDSHGIESSHSFADIGKRACTVSKLTTQQIRLILSKIEGLRGRMEDITASDRGSD